MKPDLGLPVVIQVGKGVEEQQGLVRARRAPRTHWRMPSNLARNYLNIPAREHREAIVALTRALAEGENADKRPA